MSSKVSRYPYVFLLVLAAIIFSPGSSRAQGKEVKISVTAKQYEFSPKIITVQKGDRVKLLLTSADVPHGFALDEFKIDKKINPGETAEVVFNADKVGKFVFYCSVYCGDGHPKMTGELIVTSREEQPRVNVTFDKDNPGIAIVETNGQRIRIDTRTQSVTYLEQPEQPETNGSQTAMQIAQAGQAGQAGQGHKEKPATVSEPYDYRLINLPTPKRVPRHSLNVDFTHRFSEPITALSGEGPGAHRSRIANDVLGLDSSSVSSLGFSYGITSRLYAFAYRSPLCQPGLCKTIELGFGYHILDEAGKSPVALSVKTSVEGDYNFTERYTENIQVMVERSVTHYVHLFFSPAVHINSNAGGRFDPDQLFPTSPVAAAFRLPTNTGSFGFGADARIRPSVSLMFEFTPRVGFKMGEVIPLFDSQFNIIGFKNDSEPEIGVGVQKRIGRHAFSLTLSNTQTTTTGRYNSSNLALSPSNFVIGFNIFRRLF